jgi:hypothetical protein
MKRSISKILRSSVVAVVNFCFLCGAGHLLDLGNYIIKKTTSRCQRWWQLFSKRIARNLPAQLKRQ